MYNPQRIAENHSVMVNNFTSYLLNTANLVNNSLLSNIRIYNTALKQTPDNLKGCAKQTTISYKPYQIIATIEGEILATTTTISIEDRQLDIIFNLVYNLKF